MRKKVVQQGRSERRGESYSALYVEPLSDARTPLADFFRILLEERVDKRRNGRPLGQDNQTAEQHQHENNRQEPEFFPRLHQGS